MAAAVQEDLAPCPFYPHHQFLVTGFELVAEEFGGNDGGGLRAPVVTEDDDVGTQGEVVVDQLVAVGGEAVEEIQEMPVAGGQPDQEIIHGTQGVEFFKEGKSTAEDQISFLLLCNSLLLDGEVGGIRGGEKGEFVVQSLFPAGEGIVAGMSGNAEDQVLPLCAPAILFEFVVAAIGTDSLRIGCRQRVEADGIVGGIPVEEVQELLAVHVEAGGGGVVDDRDSVGMGKVEGVQQALAWGGHGVIFCRRMKSGLNGDPVFSDC